MNIPRALLGLILGKRLPKTSGVLTLPGLESDVRIRRDAHGVVYIDASNDHDAWFGLGFCHGQDRAFQLESLKRLIRGTISELIGEDGLPIDRLSRRIGFARAAVRQLECLDQARRAMVEAYARGVTEGTTRGSRRPAHEFALLRTRPAPHTPSDVLGMLGLMSFLLASNWDSELMRYKILTSDGPDALAALDFAHPDWLPVTNPPATASGPVLDRLTDDLAAFGATVGFGGGSNNWAIAGGKTTSGRPILANDTHLAPTHPSHWYLARVSTPEWTVAGATFPGTPGMPVGMNGHGAWGVTAGLVDNTDLFVEEVRGDTVREGEDFVPAEIHVEEIQVRGGEPVVERVLVGPRGPIVGPALDGELGAISMRALWLDQRPMMGIFAFHRATSFEDLREACREWPGFPLNIVAAFENGDIGWQLMGEAPVRMKGSGAVPLAGWDPEAGWEPETISVEALPYAENPDSGFIATANNRPTSDSDGPFVGVDFLDPYRLARIDESLVARDDWDLESVGELQMDSALIPWREVRDIVLGAPVLTDQAARAISLLDDWDGVASSDSIAATVYEFFMVGMARRVAEAKAPNSTEWALGRGFSLLLAETSVNGRWTSKLVGLFRDQPEGWFAAGWGHEIAEVLDVTMATLRSRYGEPGPGWAWGTVRPLTFQHPVGARKPLDKVFNLGPFPWGGDANTVSQAAVNFRDPAANSHFVASKRMAIDVGNWDSNRFVIPGGQSGNPLSPHYADQLDLYRRGGAITIAWSPDAVHDAARESLDLKPA